MIDLTPIIQILLIVVSAIISIYLIPFIKSKLTVEKQLELEAWIEIAVAAAEQIFQGSKRGNEKKNFVINFLEKKGYKIDDEILSLQLNTLIEATVYELRE